MTNKSTVYLSSYWESDVTAQIKEILKEHPAATIKHVIDSSGCYYESDTPSHELIFTW